MKKIASPLLLGTLVLALGSARAAPPRPPLPPTREDILVLAKDGSLSRITATVIDDTECGSLFVTQAGGKVGATASVVVLLEDAILIEAKVKDFLGEDSPVIRLVKAAK